MINENYYYIRVTIEDRGLEDASIIKKNIAFFEDKKDAKELFLKKSLEYLNKPNIAVELTLIWHNRIDGYDYDIAWFNNR